MRYAKVNRSRWAIVRRFSHGAEQVAMIGGFDTRSSLIAKYREQATPHGMSWRRAKKHYGLRVVRVTLVWK